MIQTRITDLQNPSYGRPKKRKAGKRKGSTKRSKPNPLALVLGAINPKGDRTVAKKKKKKQATRSPSKKAKRAGSKNPKKLVSLATVRSLMGKTKKKGKKGKRNPASMFGHSGIKNVLGISVGVLGGVTVVKLLPPMFPASWSASDGARFLTSALVAAGISVAAHFTLPSPYRDAVWAGAGAQTLSVGLNPILRKVSSNITLGRIRQKAMGDFVNANFPEPHNPIYQRMLATAATSGGMAPGGNVGRYRGRWG